MNERATVLLSIVQSDVRDSFVTSRFLRHVHAVSVSKIILYEKDLDYNAAYMYYKLGRRQSGREQESRSN